MWHVLGRLVKPLLDAVVSLPTDDPPLALAAAAVLYFLALDVRIVFCPEIHYEVMLHCIERAVCHLLRYYTCCMGHV